MLSATNPQLKTQNSKLKTIIPALVVGLAIVVFLLLTSYQLDLPGLYADEALDVVPAMQLLNGKTLDFGPVRGAYFPLGGLKLPVMNSDYQGVVGTYGVIPFLAAGGVNVYSIRWFTLASGVLAIVLAYLWTRSLFGPTVAAVAITLLAVNPSWVFWSRIGIYVVAQIVPITIGALYCLLRWWRGGRDRWLWAGVFLLGLGFSTKFLFLWLPLALAVTYILFSLPRIATLGLMTGLQRPAREGQHGGGWRSLLISGVAFILGAFPFVWYNITTRGTYHVLRANLFHTSQGVNNADLIHNLYRVVDDWRVMLDGSFFWFQAYGGQPHHNGLYPLAYIAALALLLLGIVLAPAKDEGQRDDQPSGAADDDEPAESLSQRERFGEGEARPTSSSQATQPASAISLSQQERFGEGEANRNSNLKSQTSNLILLGVALGSFLAWWYMGSDAVVFELVFIVSFAALMGWLAWQPSRTWYHRPIVFLTVLAALVVAMSAVTVSEILPTHLLLLIPIPQMTIAAALIVAADWLMKGVRAMSGAIASTAGAALVALVVGGLMLTELGVDRDYHHDLNRIGGYYSFSDAIYQLNDYLLAKGAISPRLMDWGFQYNLQVLSDGKLNPLSIFQYTDQPDAGFYNALDASLQDPANLYVFHVPDNTARYRGRYAAFIAETQKRGLTAKLERTFYHHDGLPVYEVWSAGR